MFRKLSTFGGKQDPPTYYTAAYDWAKFDRSFNEFGLTSCHNMLITLTGIYRTDNKEKIWRKVV